MSSSRRPTRAGTGVAERPISAEELGGEAARWIPPQDLDAERFTLGAMMVEEEILPDIFEILLPEAFYRPEHRAIFSVIRDLFDSHRKIDVVTVKAELDKLGELEKAGGLSALGEMVSRVATPAHGPDYAKIVLDQYLKREIFQASLGALRDLREQGLDGEELLGRLERRIFEIAERRIRKVRKFEEFLEDVFAYLMDIRDRSKRLQGIPTGLPDLDDVLNGLQKGNFYIVAGRPSMGKTSLALRIVDHAALVAGAPVLLFSLEMPANLITRVMLCSHCHVSLDRLQKGMISELERQKLFAVSEEFQKAPIFLDDTTDADVFQLRARARRMKRDHGIQLVVVDYLQLLTAQGAESRQREISMISQNLKALSRELEIPVLALAQLNRAPEEREGKPRLADLRESGSLEQDADVVILLYREGYYKGEEGEGQGECELIMAKNRTGPTKNVRTVFLKEFMRFEPLSSRAPAGAPI